MLIERLLSWIRRRRDEAITRGLAKDDPVRNAILELCLAADKRGLDAITPPQRNVVLAWAALGETRNGGFRCYYEGDWRMREVAGAFRTLGFEAAAAACERSLAIFPGNVPPQDGGRRRKALRAAVRAGALPEGDDVLDVSFDVLQRAIGDYMARFPRDFPGVTTADRPPARGASSSASARGTPPRSDR